METLLKDFLVGKKALFGFFVEKGEVYHLFCGTTGVLDCSDCPYRNLQSPCGCDAAEEVPLKDALASIKKEWIEQQAEEIAREANFALFKAAELIAALMEEDTNGGKNEDH